MTAWCLSCHRKTERVKTLTMSDEYRDFIKQINNERGEPNTNVPERAGQEPARKGLMLCCVITAERYGDSQFAREIPKGTTITCTRCKQEIVSHGGRSWSAK